MTATAAARAGLVAGGALVGWASTGRAYDVTEPWAWGADLAVTIAFAAVAAIMLTRAPRIALLAALAALAWCLPSWLEASLYWHRGVIIHLLVIVIVGSARLWPASRLARAAIVTAYAVSITPFVWAWDAAAVVLAIALAGVGAFLRRAGRGSGQALAGLLLFAGAVLVGAVVDVVAPSAAMLEARGAAYAWALVVVAILVALALWRRTSITAADAAIELGASPDDAVREGLAAALGDSSLTVGWWAPELARFFAADHSEVIAPAPRSSRAAVLVDVDESPVALVVGEADRIDQPGVRKAVVSGARLAADHDRLTERLRDATAEVQLSRSRLIHAADEERRVLADELEREVGVRLRTLRAQLVATGAPRSEELAERALIEFDAIARGLHPVALESGLAQALSRLTARTAAAVRLHVDEGADADPLAAQVAYYVCAEAVANAVRHAHCTLIAVRVTVREDELVVTVQDDGRGGAIARPGSGLAGLRQRVAAHGGSLLIESADGGGTSIFALLPLARATAPRDGAHLLTTPPRTVPT